jgi:superfamily I DNA and/or RNA helicase
MQPAIREGRWDVIIIDECGAMPFALCYALAILARERVWFHGDPRQLPPVVVSHSGVADRWLRRDAFLASAGYEDGEDGRLHLSEHVVRIGPNRRMHPEIASLIADAYGGDLQTDPEIARARRALPALPFAHPSRKQHGVYLADTSDLAPRAELASGGSRINRVHLAVVRGLVTLLHEHQIVGPGRGSLAVITPFVAQARRHGTMLSRFFPHTVARAGSAHTWQAQEADVVVLDLVEGRGIPAYDWMRASRWSEEGARLLLVSISRARGRLIVVADVAGLRDQLEPLPRRPILLSLLDRMEDCGAIDVAAEVRGRTDELRQFRHESREMVAAD